MHTEKLTDWTHDHVFDEGSHGLMIGRFMHGPKNFHAAVAIGTKVVHESIDGESIQFHDYRRAKAKTPNRRFREQTGFDYLNEAIELPESIGGLLLGPLGLREVRASDGRGGLAFAFEERLARQLSVWPIARGRHGVAPKRVEPFPS